MVDIQTISVVIASAGVFIAAVYYIIQLRHQTKLRQTDLTMRLYQGILTKEVMNYWYQVKTREEKDYDEYIKKQGWVELYQISTFFEEVGFLLHRKLLPIDMAGELFAEPGKAIWEKNKSALKEMHSDKCFWFEYFYNEMQKREQQLAKAK